MLRARITPHTKSSMQSGPGGAGWELRYRPTEREQNDPLMGWCGSGDMQGQIRLRFDTREEAIAYADKLGIPYDVELPAPRHTAPKAYADNFRYGRTENWTH